MKIVFDTNVVVSAALKDRDPEAVLLFVVSQPDFEWVVTPEILAEYKDVLARPKLGLSEAILRRWYELLDGLTTLVEVAADLPFPRDPTDSKFLACALASSADYLVTGDKDFEAARKLIGTTILSVAMFKRLVCDPLSDTEEKATNG